MKNQMKTLALSFALLFLFAEAAMAQVVQFRVPIYMQWGTKKDTVYVGINSGGNGLSESSYGFDDALTGLYGPLGQYGENEAVPGDPDGNRVRFIDVNTHTELASHSGLWKYDYRPYDSPTQKDTFCVRIDGAIIEANDLTISWPSAATLQQYASGWEIHAFQSGAVSAGALVANMISQTSATMAMSNPLRFVIVKSGAQVPSTVSFSANDLNFGLVALPHAPITANLVVTNSGSSDSLSITAINAAGLPSNMSAVLPSLPVKVGPHGGTLSIPVTFTPTVAGSFSGTVVFTHNASGSPTTVNVLGTASSNANKLFFSADSKSGLLDGHTYRDTLGLDYHPASGTEPLKTLQCVIISERPVTLKSVTKGADLLSGNWSLKTQIYREATGPDPTSITKDSIVVTLFANDQATGLAANAVFNHLLAFEYSIGLFDNPDTLTRHISLSYVATSNRLGDDLHIAADDPQILQVVNSTYLGDVNNDGNVDILDVLLVVDHILLRINLSDPADQAALGLPADAFNRANVAPWAGHDGVVNAQDLAVIQQMALTGVDPSGVTLQKVAPTVAASRSNSALAKTNSYDALVTFHVTTSGVAVRIESSKRVKGLQFDLSSLANVPPSLKLETTIGEGHFNATANSMRVLVYDGAGASMDPGTYLMVNIPMSVKDPREVSVSDLVLADERSDRIENVNYQISLQEAPEVPVSYSLKQNYPNPFNPTTDIQFSVPQNGAVKISVYNVLGQEVRTLFDAQSERGTKVVRWDGRDSFGKILSTGVYIYRMTAGSFIDSKKMMLLK